MRPSPRSGRYRPGASRCCELRVPAPGGARGVREASAAALYRVLSRIQDVEMAPKGDVVSPTPSLVRFQVWSPRTSFCISFLLHQQNVYQARTVLCQPSKPNLNKTGSVMHKGLSLDIFF